MEYTSDDRELVRCVLLGEREAAGPFLDRFTPVVHARVARALLRRQTAARGRDLRQEVEDLVQDVFAALFDRGGYALRKWDPDRGLTLANFIGLLAEREVASILRSGRRSPWTEDPTDEGDLGFHVAQRQCAASTEHRIQDRNTLAHVLDGVYARLSPQGIHMFELLFVEQLEPDAVAEQVGMRTDAVYVWRSRLRKLAREVANGITG